VDPEFAYLKVSKKLKNEDLLYTGFAASRLRMELDKIPLWRGQHVSVRQVVEDFARYIYLPRLRNPAVVLEAMREGLRLLTWQQDTFAYAEGFDEQVGRYRGLRCGQMVNITEDDLSGLLVQPAPAKMQYEAETEGMGTTSTSTQAISNNTSQSRSDTTAEDKPVEPVHVKPKRFHGTVTLETTRLGRDAGRIADEVIAPPD
jgi:hypothetical protein